MIEPLLAGADLIIDIKRAAVPAGSADLWRLGQAGFVCRFPAATVLIDLYLSNHAEAVLPAPLDHRRLTRAPLDPAELVDGDVIICTHDHVDHLDAPTMRTLSRQLPGAVAVVPQPAAERLAALGWASRIHGTRDGDELTIGDVRLRAFAVAHEDFDEDPQLGHPYQGFAIHSGGITIAHLGDTIDHPRIRRALKDIDPDVLLVPINGRSAARKALGFAGNTSAAEAVELAAAVGARHLVPMHYDMFAQNVDDDALTAFSEAAANSRVGYSILQVGQRFRFTQPR